MGDEIVPRSPGSTSGGHQAEVVVQDGLVLIELETREDINLSGETGMAVAVLQDAKGLVGM